MQRPAPRGALLRRALLVLASLLLPAAAAGQLLPGEQPGRARVRLSITGGWATDVARQERWVATGESGAATENAEIELGGGPVATATLDVRLVGPLGLLIGGTFIQRDDAVLTVGTLEPLLLTRSRTLFGKAGLSLWLSERDPMNVRRLGGALYLAPFIARETPDVLAGFEGTGVFEEVTQVGINAGVLGELPVLGDRVALQLAFEDYFTFWDEEAAARLAHYAINHPDDPSAVTTAEVDASHQWVVRAGLSLRLR